MPIDLQTSWQTTLPSSTFPPVVKSLPQEWLSPGWQWVIFGSWSEWVEEQGPVGYTKVPVAPLMYPKTYTGVLLWGISRHLSQQTALWESQVASPLFCRGTSAALHTPRFRKLFIVWCLFKIKRSLRNCLPNAVVISPFNNIFIVVFISCSDIFQSSRFIEMYLLSTSYSWRITIWTKCVI